MGVMELIFYLDSLRIDFDEINLFCCKIDRSPQIFTQLNEWLREKAIHAMWLSTPNTILMKCLFWSSTCFIKLQDVSKIILILS